MPSISSQPSLEFCVPKEDGVDVACDNASPIIRQGSCIGDRACVNTASVQSIGIESCVGDVGGPLSGLGVCELSSGESIGDGSWYVYFSVVSFLVCTFPFQSLTLLIISFSPIRPMSKLVLKTRARLVTIAAFLITSMTVGRQHA